MSALQLYRGPRLEMRYARRAGSPLSVSLLADGEGEIEGETYEDGEVWADAESLLRWRVEHAS